MNGLKKGPLFAPLLFFSIFLLLSWREGVCGEPGGEGLSPAPARNLYVTHVVDGDTIVVSGGEAVRYIGIDTPEFGEPFFKEARDENLRLVMGKMVKLVECRDEKRDKYGRTLAWVYADGVFVNGKLLKEGLARSLIIPPCGLERLNELKALEEEAKKAGRGIWSVKGGHKEIQ